MATRFYFTTQNGISIPFVTLDASWEGTNPGFRAGLSSRRQGSFFYETNFGETSTSTTYDAEVWQFVSKPLAAQTITGTVKAIMRCKESNAAADMRSQMVIRVVSGDGGTVRGTLLAHDTSALSNEWDATALTNRKFPLNWSGAGATLTSVAAQAGDRIVVEVGYRAHNSSGTQYYGYIEAGDAASTDCAENETDTLQYNPWVKFSQNLLFLDALSRGGGGVEGLISAGSERRPLSQKSVQFGGTDEYVTMGNVLGFERTNPFSVSFWAKLPSVISGVARVISKMQLTGPTGWDVYIENTAVALELSNTSPGAFIRAYASCRVTDNVWHHAVVTWDGDATPGAAGVKIYIDGVLGAMTISSDTLGSNSILNTADLFLGQQYGGSFLIGNLDDVAVYNKKLSADEVKMLSQGYSPSVVASANLVGYWKMGDGDTHPTLLDTGNSMASALGANDTKDLSGNGYHGSTTNMEIGDVVSDVAGGPFATKSYLFDGVNEYVTMGNVLGFERTSAFSLSYWFKTSAPAGCPVGKATASSVVGYGTWINATALWFNLYNTVGSNELIVRTPGPYSDGSWHHVVWSYQGDSVASNVRCCMDGVEVTPVVVANTLSGSILNAAPFQIGSRDAGASTFFAGNIDEVAVYSRALSVAEAQWIYNSGKPRDLKTPGAPSGLVGWWRLGEGAFPGTMTLMESGDIGYDVPMLPIWPAGGVYAAEVTSGVETASTNRGSVERRSGEALISPLGGGSPFMAGGEYGAPWLPNMSTASTDKIEVRTPAFSMGGGLVPVGAVTFYKMRGRDSGAAPPGYVTWVVSGEPDFLGNSYSGGTPTPVGPMIIGSAVVADSWEE